MYYKCHKINPNCGGSYIHSPDWIKKKKATINQINKYNNKSFQYGVTAALNHKKIKKVLQRITKIKPFVNKHDWKEVDFSLEKKALENIWEK